MLVAGKVHFRRGLSTSELADAIDGAEAAIRAAVPVARMIYLEPDLYEAGHGDSGAAGDHGTDHH